MPLILRHRRQRAIEIVAQRGTLARYGEAQFAGTPCLVERDTEVSECATGKLRADCGRETEICIGFAAFDGSECGQRIGIGENVGAWIALGKEALKRETLFDCETGALQLAARERRAALLARHYG